jgi:hypothetical protein
VEIYIINEYDRRTLYLMILKCYHHLHPMTKSVGCVDQIIDENYCRNHSLGLVTKVRAYRGAG